MPTITALTSVAASELIGLDNAYLPVVSSGQTKKLQFQQMRETLIPKVLQQAVAGNSDELTFNNPSSIKVDVYGRVTAVSEGGGTPVRIEGLQLDSQDFEGGGTVINQGTPYIAHKTRFPLSAGDFYIVPPFKANKSGHLTDGFLITDIGLYNERSNFTATRAKIGLGVPVPPPEVDVAAYTLQTQVESLQPSNFNDYTNFLKLLLNNFRYQERIVFELLDRVNLLSYTLREFGLGTPSGYIGAADNTFNAHRSLYLGVYNFIPVAPGDSASSPWTSAGISPAVNNYYRLDLDDGLAAGTVGTFRSPLALAPAESSTLDRIWTKLRIDAVYTPLAAFVKSTEYAWGGYAGSVQSIQKTYEFTEASLTAGSGTDWTTTTGSNGVRYVRLNTPTIAQLRTINASFATGLDANVTSNVGGEDWYKNQLAVTLQYSGIADAQWIPSASSAILPNTANTGVTKIISFGSSGLFTKTVAQV
jgi:hypothetical protein